MPTELHERGLARRKQVLGVAQVEQTYAGVDKFTAPFQEVVNEFVWGAVWARPGLETSTRCLLTIGMLTALNRPNELKTHMHAALANGVSREQIMETLLHANAYCGAPAAVEAFRCMREVFAAADAAANAAKPK